MAKDQDQRELCEEWKARRLELGLTQEEIAQDMGITQAAYSAIESGRFGLTLEQIKRVSAALKMRASIQLAKA